MTRTDAMVASGYDEPSSPSDVWTRDGRHGRCWCWPGGRPTLTTTPITNGPPQQTGHGRVAPILAGASRLEARSAGATMAVLAEQPAGPGFSSHSKTASSERPDPTWAQRPRPCLVRRVAPGQARTATCSRPDGRATDTGGRTPPDRAEA
jgi:hypothetical protein